MSVEVIHKVIEQRSRNMSAIKSKNTKPEIAVRKLLYSMGYRFRLHRKDLPGSPDIVLPKYKTAISGFVFFDLMADIVLDLCSLTLCKTSLLISLNSF